MANTTTTVTNPEYYYKFVYRYKDTLVEYSFDADVNFQKLLTRFKHFCKACSWTEKVVERVIPDDEEEY